MYVYILVVALVLLYSLGKLMIDRLAGPGVY